MSASRAPYAALAQSADEVELKEHLLEHDQPTEGGPLALPDEERAK